MTTITGRRQMLLATLHGLEHDLAEAEVAIAQADAAPAATSDDAYDALVAHEHNLRFTRARVLEDYLAGLVPLPVSRCPFTDEIVALPVDVIDFDGPFWDARNPVRPRPANRPRTLVAWTGAVRLDPDRLPVTAHLVTPGPGVPYVVPDLLEDPTTVAVISSVPVAGHAGWLIAWYAPATAGHLRWNEWGTDRWLDPDGARWVDEDEEAWITDLAPLVASGRVRWIAPGDASLAVRTGTDGCPYLDLEGTPRMQRLQHGEVWTLDDL